MELWTQEWMGRTDGGKYFLTILSDTRRQKRHRFELGAVSLQGAEKQLLSSLTVLTKWGKGLKNYTRVPTMRCFNLSISEMNCNKIGPGSLRPTEIWQP